MSIVINRLSIKCFLFVRPRRKFQIAVEALFMIDFPSLKHKFSFFLDRKQMRVTLDVASNSIIHSKHFNVPNINETSIIRSLAFHFHENTVALHVDCSESAKVDIDVGLSKLYFQMDEPIVKLFRERKYPLHFDTTVQAAFGRSNCQKGTNKHNGKRFNRNRQLDKGTEHIQLSHIQRINEKWIMITFFHREKQKTRY